MSDNDGKKTLGVRGGGPRAGNVKQSFSHGRTKNVVVETKLANTQMPKFALFNLKKDPAERENVLVDHPDVADRMKKRLANIIADGRTRP